MGIGLGPSDIRVLASLIEKEAAVPESYPLTLNALRLACNQSTNRRPVVAYDDRTVDNALMGLKSVGLVRFVHPSHGGRTIRYRHVADERWHLSAGELLVLSALALRGPQTVNEIKARVERLLPADETSTVEAMLDTLAARSPEPFAVRLDRRPGEREDRWAPQLGSGDETWDDGDEFVDSTTDLPRPSRLERTADVEERVDQLAALTARVEELSAVIGALAGRLDRLERDLGV